MNEDAKLPPGGVGTPGLASRLESSAVWALLVFGLGLPIIVGRATTYIVLVIGVAAWLVLLVGGRLRDAYRPFAGGAWLIAFLLLALQFALTMHSPGDMMRVFNFIALPLGGVLLLLFTRAAGRISPATAALMAAGGVLLALVMMAIIGLQGNPRPEGINLGPIILPNATIALSTVAATGAIALRSRSSLLLPLAIAAAVEVALITQSRGPLLAVPPLVILTLFALWRTRLGGRGWWLGITGLTVAAVGVAAFAANRASSIPGILTNLARGGGSGDLTTDIRLALYRASWRAFLDAPWLGHGWGDLISLPLPYVDPAFLQAVSGLHHLHNDFLTFAVAGGVAGIALFLLILLTPLVAAYRSPRDTLRPARLYGTTAIAVVYACAGLTDIALGQEFHRMMFVLLNAVVLGLFREAPETIRAQALVRH